MRADRPVRVQHRSGALWMLNTAGLTAIRAPAADHPGLERGEGGWLTGRLWRADDWLRSRLPQSGPPGLTRVGTALLRHGITGVTDATPDLDDWSIAAISDAMAQGDLPSTSSARPSALRCPATRGGRAPPPGHTRSCWPTRGCPGTTT